jgi:hypothetical protein
MPTDRDNKFTYQDRVALSRHVRHKSLDEVYRIINRVAGWLEERYRRGAKESKTEELYLILS